MQPPVYTIVIAARRNLLPRRWGDRLARSSMATQCASGRSLKESTTAAITEAVEEAMAPLRAAGVKPRVGLVFAASRHALDAALARARELTGGADIVGCSTA